MMFKRKCKITFIRHGSTIYTEENRFSDNENYPPLNDEGKEEAKRIAQWVSQRSPKVDKIYTSSALKTIQTCKYIASEYAKDFEILDSLNSRKAGLWNGLTFEQIEKKYPEMLDAYHKNPIKYWVEDGENTLELAKRIKRAITNLTKGNVDKRLILVTHGDIIQIAICLTLDIPLENYNKIYIPPGSATQISYFKEWASLVYSGSLPLS